MKKSLLSRWMLPLLLVAMPFTTACDDEDDPVSVTPEPTIVDVAVANNFTTLVAAVQAADLVDVLNGDGPFTVFAPTDEAFADLPDGTLDDLLLPENKSTLIAILQYHVVAGEVTAEQVVNLTTAQTLEGSSLDIMVENGTVKINDATVETTDVEASNGVIHVIDTVLLPPVQ